MKRPEELKTSKAQYRRWCKLGGVTPEFQRVWHNEIEYWLECKRKHIVTKQVAESWVNEALN